MLLWKIDEFGYHWPITKQNPKNLKRLFIFDSIVNYFIIFDRNYDLFNLVDLLRICFVKYGKVLRMCILINKSHLSYTE